MVAPAAGNPGYSQFGGFVADKVSPGSIRVEKTVSGSCRMLANPTFSCSPACSSSGTECVARTSAAPPRSGIASER